MFALSFLLSELNCLASVEIFRICADCCSPPLQRRGFSAIPALTSGHESLPAAHILPPATKTPPLKRWATALALPQEDGQLLLKRFQQSHLPLAPFFPFLILARGCAGRRFLAYSRFAGQVLFAHFRPAAAQSRGVALQIGEQIFRELVFR